MVKNLPANAGDTRDLGSIPGSGRSPGGGHGNPLQYSCLENPQGQESGRLRHASVAESDTPEATEYALAYTSVMGNHDPQPSVFDNNYMPV